MLVFRVRPVTGKPREPPQKNFSSGGNYIAALSVQTVFRTPNAIFPCTMNTPLPAVTVLREKVLGGSTPPPTPPPNGTKICLK